MKHEFSKFESKSASEFGLDPVSVFLIQSSSRMRRSMSAFEMDASSAIAIGVYERLAFDEPAKSRIERPLLFQSEQPIANHFILLIR
jgi:hypothetical protein